MRAKNNYADDSGSSLIIIATLFVLCFFGLFIVAGVLHILFENPFVFSSPDGYAGVTSNGAVLEGNINLKAPWQNVTVYDYRLKWSDFEESLKSSDGEKISIEGSFGYSIDSSRILDLHNRYGQNYFFTLVSPSVIASLNKYAANKKASEIYEDVLISDKITEVLHNDLSGKPVVVERVIVKEISKPKSIIDKEAVIAKRAAVQKAIEDEQINAPLVLEKAKTEAEMMRIKAQGLADSLKLLESNGVNTSKYGCVLESGCGVIDKAPSVVETKEKCGYVPGEGFEGNKHDYKFTCWNPDEMNCYTRTYIMWAGHEIYINSCEKTATTDTDVVPTQRVNCISNEYGGYLSGEEVGDIVTVLVQETGERVIRKVEGYGRGYTTKESVDIGGLLTDGHQPDMYTMRCPSEEVHNSGVDVILLGHVTGI